MAAPRRVRAPAPAPIYGPIETAVRADLTTAGVVTSALGTLAISLAHRIDADAGEPVAPLSKELRAALAEVLPKEPPSVDVLAGLLDRLSTPLLHTAN